MTLTITQDVPTGKDKNVFYAKKGDKVELITDSHSPALIVSLNGERIPVHVDKTNYYDKRRETEPGII